MSIPEPPGWVDPLDAAAIFAYPRNDAREPVMTDATPKYPAPSYSHRAYGVDLEWFGEDGGMAARGHVPDLRFIAACNHLARTQASMRNLWDDRSVTLDDVLAAVTRVWATPIAPEYGFPWGVYYGRDNTEHTPGAIPMTVLLP